MLRCRATTLVFDFYKVSIATTVTLLTLHATVACPADVTHAVFACFGTLTKTTASNFLVAGGDVRQLRDKCRDGSFTRTVTCVHSLFRLCSKRPSRMKRLEYLIDPFSVRRSFKRLCQHFEMYARNSPCLKRHSGTIQRCIRTREHLFSRLQSAPHSFEYRSREDHSNLICSFFSGVTKCIERPVRAFCSCQLADFIIEFMSGIASPTCSRYEVTGDCKLSGSNLVPYHTYILVIPSLYSLYHLMARLFT